MKLFSQIFSKCISIFSLLKIFFLKFYANGFPYILFAQEFFFSSSLQIGTHVGFSQDLCETTSCKSNSWTNQICSKLNKFNPSLKLHQELFSPNKSIVNQPNLFKSTTPWKLHGSTWIIMCDGVVLNYINVSWSFCLWWIVFKV
jgi:hypothetical protein